MKKKKISIKNLKSATKDPIKDPTKDPIKDPTKDLDIPNDKDARFAFNELTIDFFTKDLDLKKICIKKSVFKNDTALLCLLFKVKVFNIYKCSIKKCKTGKTWLGKPIQLLISRKNNKMEDLTIENLELMCPNCFISLYGLELFQKTLDQTIYKCKLCKFPLNKFSNTKKKDGYCTACESKIINSSYYTKQIEYIDELKQTINNESTPDDFTTSKYYNEVSQFKTFKDHTHSNKKINKSTNNTPIINLNMNTLDLTNLLNDINE